MVYISTERIKKILKRYETEKDLFNWCNEYKSFIRECIGDCMSMEVEYILKKSYEDKYAPLSYGDLDLFDIDKAKESILYMLENNIGEEDLKKYFDDANEKYNRRIKTLGDYEVFLNSLDKEELKDLCSELEIYEDSTDGEVFEWWTISDPLKYRLEQQGEIFLNGGCATFWGRQTTGQSIELDGCCIKAFIEMIKDNIANRN